jgi:ketosteroid isomerase-like protein
VNIESMFADGFAVRIRHAEVETIAAFPAGDSIAAHWRMRATLASGQTVDVIGVDVLRVRADGRIARVEGYWDPSALA